MHQVVHHASFDGRSVAWASVGTGPVLVCGGWWSAHLDLDWQDPRSAGSWSAWAPRSPSSATTSPARDCPTASAHRPCGLEEELAALAAVVDAVGQPRVNLFGGSSGSPVAAAYAGRYPDSRRPAGALRRVCHRERHRFTGCTRVDDRPRGAALGVGLTRARRRLPARAPTAASARRSPPSSAARPRVRWRRVPCARSTPSMRPGAVGHHQPYPRDAPPG